ncbi:MAG: LCP family protein, partial [Frankiales bacterium]|nr:LCP family protein [Frankiales bacterium]
MSDSKDWKAGGDDAAKPALPPHLDPRGGPRSPRGGLPPRPPRTVLPKTHKLTAPPRRRRVARALSWVAVATSVAVLGSAVGGYVLVNRYNSNINRIDVFGADRQRPQDAPRDAQNILIVGSDSRGNLAAGQGTQGRGSTFVTGQRSDTVILAHLFGDTDKAQLVSFPRDSWVTIPAYTDPKSGKTIAEHDAKLNSAFFEGGPALLVSTIESLTGVFVDHYMQVDFDGFQTIVNRLDGVEVCLSRPAKEKDSGIDLPAGRQIIKGDQALAFVRQRKGLPNGDVDRIRRQQQFIGAIVRKVLSAGTLANPLKLNGVITAATESLDVDKALTISDLQDLALRFRSFSAGGVIFTTVPIADINARRQRQSVVLLDEPGLASLSDRLRRDLPPDAPEPTPTTSGAASALTVAPSAVRVQVFNGAGVSGLGRKAFVDLDAVGFQMVGVPGNRGSGATRTTVFHGPDKADSARTLAASIPGAVSELDPSLTGTLQV